MFGKADPAHGDRDLRPQHGKGQRCQPDPFCGAPVLANQRAAKTEFGDLPEYAKDHPNRQREPDSRLLRCGGLKTELFKHPRDPLDDNTTVP